MKQFKLKKNLYFGEKVEGYNVRVFNEREVRAAAGILFFFAVTAFFNAFLTSNFFLLKAFVTTFLVDFSIRLFINPKYSPVMILGRFAVSNQTVEYSGAPQKKFAWALGLILATTMFYLVVIKNSVGLLNLSICILCLILLFFETSFGICLGCKVYNLFNKEKAQLCPGGACAIKRKEEIQNISYFQAAVAIVFIIFVIGLVRFFGM